ncbi:hypothetical protein EGW08_012099, partial [Elysia chlorotica]
MGKVIRVQPVSETQSNNDATFKHPSDAQSQRPSKQPLDAQSQSPSKQPSDAQSQSPSKQPSDAQSQSPSKQPSDAQSQAPSKQPSDAQSQSPSKQPSDAESQTTSKHPPDVQSHLLIGKSPAQSQSPLSYLQRLQSFITSSLERLFHRLGVSIGHHPERYIVVCVLVCSLSSLGLLAFKEVDDPEKLWVPIDAK